MNHLNVYIVISMYRRPTRRVAITVHTVWCRNMWMDRYPEIGWHSVVVVCHRLTITSPMAPPRYCLNVPYVIKLIEIKSVTMIRSTLCDDWSMSIEKLMKLSSRIVLLWFICIVMLLFILFLSCKHTKITWSQNQDLWFEHHW